MHLTEVAGEEKTGTSLTLISALSVGGLLLYVIYWRFPLSHADPCRLKAATTALHAFAFHTCNAMASLIYTTAPTKELQYSLTELVELCRCLMLQACNLLESNPSIGCICSPGQGPPPLQSYIS